MDVAHVSIPKLGEHANGDRAFHRQDDGHRIMLSVIDALGHGPEAEVAALAGLKYLAEVPLEDSLHDIMHGLHASLRGTRGASATVCITHNRRLFVCAVGNVELRPVRTEIPLISSAGILGSRVQKFRICEAELKAACRLVMFSDGIANPTTLNESHRLPPKAACDAILRQHRRTYDDATVLIADVE